MPRTRAAAVPAARPILRDRAAAANAESYATLKAEIAEREAELDRLKPLLLGAMGDHESVTAGNRVLTKADIAPIAPTPNVRITRDMVGQVIPGKKGRRGYTQLTVQ